MLHAFLCIQTMARTPFWTDLERRALRDLLTRHPDYFR